MSGNPSLLRESIEAAVQTHFATGRHGMSRHACGTAVAMAVLGTLSSEGQLIIPRVLYESLCRAAEKALEPTGEHRKIDGYCPDCQGQCLRDWLGRPPLPPSASKDRQWDGS
jgi:hypothetical protein